MSYESKVSFGNVWHNSIDLRSESWERKGKKETYWTSVVFKYICSDWIPQRCECPITCEFTYQCD